MVGNVFVHANSLLFGSYPSVLLLLKMISFVCLLSLSLMTYVVVEWSLSLSLSSLAPRLRALTRVHTRTRTHTAHKGTEVQGWTVWGGD